MTPDLARYRDRRGRRPWLPLPAYQPDADGACVCRLCCDYDISRFTLRQVAAAWGCSHERARQLLIDHGTTIRPWGRARRRVA